MLENDVLRERYVDAGTEAVGRYDWSVVALQIMRVYETVAGSGTKVQVAGTPGWGHRPPEGRGESVGGTARPQARGTTGGIR